MSDALGRILPEYMTGKEEFLGTGQQSILRLVDYWRWSGANLLDNSARGILAEFLVASAIGKIHETPRSEWDPYDLETTLGERTVKIEVKSSARIQSWKQKVLSPIEFRIAPTKYWDPDKGAYLSDKPHRWADIYVFCALNATDLKAHVDALDTNNWQFFVLHRNKLRDLPTQEKIRIKPLLKKKPICCDYRGLKKSIERVAMSSDDL